jgi:hypothetical protein
LRLTARSCLIILLISGLLDIPAFAAKERPLGLVIQALEAHVDDATLAVGTTLYSGDTVATDVGGALRLKLGGSQLYLLGSSAATLTQNPAILHALVSRGTVGFSSDGTERIELEIPQGVIRAVDGQPAYGQVTITGPQEVVISAYRGDLNLDNDGEVHTIPTGKTYRVTMDLEPAAQPAPPSASSGDSPIVAPRRRRLVFDLILVGGTAIASYFIWRELSESPSKPSH